MTGYEIVPTDDARALVAYLLSLHSDGVIFETPPFPSTNKQATATSSNAVPAATNSATTNSLK